jgi:hypothetical protein
LEGSYFRNLVREHAERHQAHNLHLLERIHILDGLSNVQKVNVGAVTWTQSGAGDRADNKSLRGAFDPETTAGLIDPLFLNPQTG